ncbi:aminotransferase class I/II-fold pyridoxal phosphate-dependent enzyme [bacterium]|nr:aminotransferase class I/II-fold pyridoxal phosphate-dependent enzyme [bacterium]
MSLRETCQARLDAIEAEGKMKSFNYLQGPMDRSVKARDIGDLLVMSSNNYLGLANHPEVIEAGIEGLETYGAGTASVRFICGTFDIHEELEKELAGLARQERALSYVSCWCANEGLIPTISGPNDVLISDELNHASLIDACRLAKKTTREIYRHADLKHLEELLKAHADKENRYVVTDGVFSMEGTVAPLDDIVDLCRKHDASLIVDDSHGTGVLGKHGRGTGEHFGVEEEIDALTSTLGKALGGAAGGFVASSAAVIGVLEQMSRPQIFSNALPPTVASSALRAVRVLKTDQARVDRLQNLTKFARDLFREAGYDVSDNPTAIIPVILGETKDAIRASKELLKRGIFITGFGFPVVPEGTARLRIQVSAAHTEDDFRRVLEELKKIVPPKA